MLDKIRLLTEPYEIPSDSCPIERLLIGAASLPGPVRQSGSLMKLPW